MSSNAPVIIRLQWLSIDASSADVRQFFHNLKIPEGGVHIVGGSEGDAFIAFATDEDARRAMQLDGQMLRGSRVKLFLSSRNEMQQIVAKARAEFQALQEGRILPNAVGGAKAKRLAADSRSPTPDRKRTRSPYNDDEKLPLKQKFSGYMAQLEPNYVPSAASAAAHQMHFQQQMVVKPSQPVQGQHQSGSGNSFLPVAAAAATKTNVAAPEQQKGSLQQQLLQNFASLPLGVQQQLLGQLAGKSGAGANQAATLNDFGGSNDSIVASLTTMLELAKNANTSIGTFASSTSTAAAPVQSAMMNFNSGILAHNNNSFVSKAHPILAPPSDRRKGLLVPPPIVTAKEEGPNIPPLMPEFGGPAMSLPMKNGTGDSFSMGHRDRLVGGAEQYPSRRRFGLGDPVDNKPLHEAFDIPPIIPRSRCVMMMNLPLEYRRYNAIRDFVAPIELRGGDCIKIVCNDRGQKTGDAFCRFRSVEDCQQVLEMNGKDGIRICECSEQAFDAVVDGLVKKNTEPDSYRGGGGGGGGDHYRDRDREPKELDLYVVRFENVAFRATRHEIGELLESYGIGYRAIEIENSRRDRKPTGRVFVHLDCAMDEKLALSLSDQIFMDRKLTVRRSTPEEMEANIDCKLERRARRISQSGRRSKSRSMERPSSTGIEQQNPTAVVPNRERRKGSAERTSSKDDHPIVKIYGYDRDATDQDIMQFFSEVDCVPIKVVQLGRSNGDILPVAFVEFHSQIEATRAMKRDREYLLKRFVSVRKATKSEMEVQSKKHGVLSSSGGAATNSRSNLQESPPNSNAKNGVMNTVHLDPGLIREVGEPGCVLALQNLPPGTSLQDIEKFLKGYRVAENSVRMHYDDTGKPTGNCLLALVSAEEAKRASNLLHLRLLQDQRVGVLLAV